MDALWHNEPFCPECNGRGLLTRTGYSNAVEMDSGAPPHAITRPCPKCGGTGYPLDKTYLGDAVFAMMNEGSIRLTTEYGRSEFNTILLDPPAIAALLEFITKHAAEIKPR